MRSYLILAAAAFVVGCNATGSLDDAYLHRIADSTVYNKRVPQGRGSSANAQQRIEDVFRRDRLEILKALQPYIRTFDGNEYPQVAVELYGLESRESDAEIVFYITISAAVSPRKGLGRGGLRPLVDDSYLAGVVWDHRRRLVRHIDVSGSQCRAVPPEALAEAVALASAHDPAFLAKALVRRRIRWLPAWFTKQDPPLAKLNTRHNIVSLPFALYGNDLSKTPVAVVSVDVAASRVVHIERQIWDCGPTEPPPHREPSP